ncbi:MAG: LarC family nickel insertion protein, partial [Deltaproteobacteria bacterium]|nr:LarC family nickel insertion protein [Deltaproteobacteria bacterium]
WVETSHGMMPLPSPATLELLKGIPVEPSPVRDEVVTPTGAAIITTVAEGFGTIPKMKIEEVGYGIGDKDFKEIPNLLRIIVGEGDGADMERLIVLETNIDDMNPQIYEYLMEVLFDGGALDVFLVPIQMKKGRPAILLHVLCAEGKKDTLMDIIFKESTSIGVRCYPVTRYCLEREIREVSTPYGKVRVKVSKKDGKVLNIQPEYEDCKRIAREKKVPLKDVISVAQEGLLLDR